MCETSSARRFYEGHFGFEKPVVEGEDFLILRNAEGFDLALLEDPKADPLPQWFHFGFRMHSADGVHRMHDTLSRRGVPIVRPLSEEDFLHFRCADPDGHEIEIYYD